MVVYSNRSLGAAEELFVSSEVACAMLAEVAAAARQSAQGRWELELVQWLELRTSQFATDLDVADIAWSPENFERQRTFVLDAIERATTRSDHARALGRWSRLIANHPRHLVQVGRRWARPLS